MTKPKDDGVKRWNYRQIQAAYNSTDMQHPLYIEAAEHDRVVAELQAKVETLSLESFQARVKIDMHQCPVRVPLPESYWEAKYNTARKVIAKLRQQRDWWCGIASRYGYTGPSGDEAEIEAIERGEK